MAARDARTCIFFVLLQCGRNRTTSDPDWIRIGSGFILPQKCACANWLLTLGAHAFFAFGAMGAFHGKLNPISGRTIFETCVVPIFLYGCENWILTTPLLDRLEAFQGEIGRRILKLSLFHSTLSVRLALRWPSVPARILIQKLNLLAKISSDEDTVGGRIYSKLSAIDPQSLQIVQECKSLEEKLKCRGVTQSMLKLECSSREAKKLIMLYCLVYS